MSFFQVQQAEANFELFEKLEATTKRTEKAKLLETASEADKTLLYLALNPDLIYHIQKVDHENRTSGEIPDSTSIPALWRFCHLLNEKKALTNQDRYDIASFLACCGVLKAKWYERVFLKDLRIGVDVSTINKIWPGFITTYDCALADVYDPEKHEDRLGNSFVDVKLDGIRCLGKVENGKVTLRSRNGKILTTFPQIEEELSKLPDGLYDGEIYVHGKNGFQELMKYVKRDKPAPNEIPFRYYIFDVVNQYKFETRSDDLADQLISVFGDPIEEGEFLLHVGQRLGLTTFCHPSNNAELINYLDMALAEGYEGLMVKDKDAPYIAKRSKNILKVKRFYSAEAKVVGWTQGKGRLLGRLGTLVLETPEGIQFEVGSGFDDQQRGMLYLYPEKQLGRIVEYKYQELSKDNVPRFPIFLRFRDDLEYGL